MEGPALSENLGFSQVVRVNRAVLLIQKEISASDYDLVVRSGYKDQSTELCRLNQVSFSHQGLSVSALLDFRVAPNIFTLNAILLLPVTHEVGPFTAAIQP